MFLLDCEKIESKLKASQRCSLPLPLSNFYIKTLILFTRKLEARLKILPLAKFVLFLKLNPMWFLVRFRNFLCKHTKLHFYVRGMYLWLRRINEFDFSADGSTVLSDINVAGSDQTSLFGRFVLSVQVNEHIDLKRAGLFRLRQVDCTDNGQFAVGQSQNGRCQKKITGEFYFLFYRLNLIY